MARAGYDVTLVAPHERSETVHGVKIHAVPKPAGKKQRMKQTIWQVYRAALEEDGKLYHFHDPELIPVGALLKLRGKKVVYDIHEDVPKQVISKAWIPPSFRKPISSGVAVLERISNRIFDGTVTATAPIAARFPDNKCVVLQNMPMLEEFRGDDLVEWENRPNHVAYFGSMTRVRGTVEMVKAVSLLPDDLNVKLILAGKISPCSLENEIKLLPGWGKIQYLGMLERVRLRECFKETKIGLHLPFPIPNYLDAIPTKIFEYMAAEIPFIATDLPILKKIAEETQTGLIVPPGDPDAVAKAVEWLLTHPVEAKMMGKRGREAVLETYNWDVEVSKLLEFYARILGVNSNE